MHEFTVKISLNEDDIEDVKRLNVLTKQSAPYLFGNDTLEDTIGFVARSGFGEALQCLLYKYQNDGKEEGVNT